MKLFKLFLFVLAINQVIAQENEIHFFRHLKYNHVSPYIDLVGIYPINEPTAQSTSHYMFVYDKLDRILEITNYHYHTERQHPLASIGVYRIVFSYPNNQEIRIFYDKNGNRITNDREVYKEIYTFKRGFKTKLQFYDINDNPMESNWGISEYNWSEHNDLVIEKRYNLKNEPVSLSPYFEFDITGIRLDKNGSPLEHLNLDDNLNIVANSTGIASYRDIYDTVGNHVRYSYHDVNGKLAINQWGFAYGEKSYDSIGNYIELNQFGVNKEHIRGRKIPSNSKIEMAKNASQKDSIEIRNMSLGYLIALQELKPNLMNDVLNDSLNKITIGWDRSTKKEYARSTTKAQMIEFAQSWNKSGAKFPFNPENDIIILDIYNRIANVKLVSDNWVEYLHLIKLDGQWSVVNLIWQHKDIGRYPKE